MLRSHLRRIGGRVWREKCHGSKNNATRFSAVISSSQLELRDRRESSTLASDSYRLSQGACPRNAINMPAHSFKASTRLFATATATETDNPTSEKREFQAETRMLLDIVAKSLYSEKEVFIRELISNASDALEKLRYLQLNNTPDVGQRALEIGITTDKANRQIIIQDSGVGLTKEELIEHLGTIAKSGSKAFMKQIEDAGEGSVDNIIGQFGVGFYSAFMVANKVEVFTKSYKPDSVGYRWVSDGSGFYEISEAEDVESGTKIIVHLKAGDAAEYAEEPKVKEVITRYSNFVGSPIFLNGEKVNTVEALWTQDPKDIPASKHEEFFRFMSHQAGRPQYTIHYKTDAPVSIRALLYVPTDKPSMFELAQESEPAVSLYSRRVLIQSRTANLLPRWMRFMKGVVDSEDIPLNLSRELLQQTALLAKIKEVLSNRCLKFFRDQMKKDLTKYEDFYKNFSIFMKEAIVSSTNQQEKEDVSKLLLFESSNHRRGHRISFQDYCEKLQAGQRDIYYLCAPSRELAENSPYYEAMKEKNFEVLFCYEPHDELVMLSLQQIDRKNLISVEKFIQQDKSDVEKEEDGPLTQREMTGLLEWIQYTLGSKRVHQIKTTNKLSSFPCVVTVEEMGAARHYMRTALHDMPQDQRYMLLKPTLEINPRHPIITSLSELRKSDESLAELLVHQIFDNAMASAGLLDDPRLMVNRLNDLLGRLAQKTITAKDTILRP